MQATLPRFILLAIALPSSSSLAQQATTLPSGPVEPTRVRPDSEIIIYRDRNFSGPAVAIAQDRPNLGLVWTVSSVRVQRGTWEVCERSNYRGPCLTLTDDKRNLGSRRIQSARLIRTPPVQVRWRALGGANVDRIGLDRNIIRTPGNPRISELRLCAENSRLRLFSARARFTNGMWQAITIPSEVDRGRCTRALPLSGPRRNLHSVEVTARSSGAVRGRVRVEGR